jgi:hypothetical protein
MKAEYTTDRVRVLYEFLRRKIAHLAYPTQYLTQLRRRCFTANRDDASLGPCMPVSGDLPLNYRIFPHGNFW